MPIAMAHSINTTWMVISDTTGAAISDESKCIPSTCSKPLAVSLARKVPFDFFFIAQVSVKMITFLGTSLSGVTLKTWAFTIRPCSLSTAFSHSAASGPAIASLYFMGWSSMVLTKPPPSPAPTKQTSWPNDSGNCCATA